MEIKKIQRTRRLNGIEKISIGLRIPKPICDWMKFRNVSPTSLFIECAKELMEKDRGWNKKRKNETKTKIQTKKEKH